MDVNLVYVSDSQIPDNVFAEEIANIRSQSLQRNSERDITGFLFFFEGKFVQILEGSFENVSTLFSSIRKDHRHSNIRLNCFIECKKRSFSEWSMDTSMAFVALNHRELSVKLRFLGRFINETSYAPINLIELLVSIAEELKRRPDFPRGSPARLRLAT